MYINKLQIYRKKKGLTQEQMAILLGYKNKSAYCHLEKGRVKITVDQLLRICEILGVDIKEIF